jgi:hypothetical protein
MHRRSRLVRYGFAILVSLAAALARLWLGKANGVTPTYITFYPAVVVAAALAGFEAGLVATGVSALLAELMYSAINMYPRDAVATHISFVVFPG